MNALDDIVQLVILCAIVFIPTGYLLHRRFPNWQRSWQNLLLSPRYLKSAGLLRVAENEKVIHLD